MAKATEQAKALIAARGGTIRTRDAIAAGIHPRTLYALRDEGALQRLGRGLYRLTNLPPLGDPDLALNEMRYIVTTPEYLHPLESAPTLPRGWIPCRAEQER